MTSVYREEARDARRRERSKESVDQDTLDLITKLNSFPKHGGPAILDHVTVWKIVARLEKLVAFEKLADRGRP